MVYKLPKLITTYDKTQQHHDPIIVWCALRQGWYNTTYKPQIDRFAMSYESTVYIHPSHWYTLDEWSFYGNDVLGRHYFYQYIPMQNIQQHRNGHSMLPTPPGTEI